MRPKLLDLFCKAGGASEGYFLAGFDVVGVDIKPQRRYPFEFYQADAIETLNCLLMEKWRAFDQLGYTLYSLSDFVAFHASPPCQASSLASKQWRLAGKKYPQLISQLRERLLRTGKPFVIENVRGSPLLNPVMLTAAMFGLKLKRDRYFESHCFDIPFTLSPTAPKPVKMGRAIRDGDILQPVGHFSGVAYARREMQLPYRTQEELAEALPRAYTEYIGKYLMQAVKSVRTIP